MLSKNTKTSLLSSTGNNISTSPSGITKRTRKPLNLSKRNKNKVTGENKKLLSTNKWDEDDLHETRTLLKIVCPICSLEFIDQHGYEEHALKCSKNQSQASMNNDAIELTEKCPICDSNFSTLDTATDKEVHINTCLDKGTIEENLMKTDELLARSLQEHCIPPDSTYFCSFCLKDLSNFNTSRRQVHVNSCADNNGDGMGRKLRRRGKVNPEKSKRKLCPLCQKYRNETVQYSLIYCFNNRMTGFVLYLLS